MDIMTKRTVALGLASWLLPFLVSFLFIDRAGQSLIPQPLFKSIMVVVGGGVGTALLAIAFRQVTPTLRSGLALGLLWLCINLALDIVVLVPMMKVSVTTYVQDVGLRYLLIPIIAAGIGLVAERERVAR